MPGSFGRRGWRPPGEGAVSHLGNRQRKLFFFKRTAREGAEYFRICVESAFRSRCAWAATPPTKLPPPPRSRRTAYSEVPEETSHKIADAGEISGTGPCAGKQGTGSKGRTPCCRGQYRRACS